MLRYQAGPRALSLIRRQGLDPEAVKALVAPATGPKWLTIAGLDRALIERGFLERRGSPVLVVGASAGSWRAAALASCNPLATHLELERRYIAQHFTRHDGPAAVSASYRRLLAEVFSDADVKRAVSHPALSLALYAARARRTSLATAAGRSLKMAGLGATALANAVHPRAQDAFFERTLFCAGGTGAAPLLGALAGTRAPLRTTNLRDVLLASGSVPLYMAPVTDIDGAKRGYYLDGGLLDYHLAQPLDTEGRGVVLMFLHQERIIPGWFDKMLPWRRGSRALTRDLLLVYPTPRHVAGLPGGQVPTREDFQRFIDDPDERRRRWGIAASESDRLGEQLARDLETGDIARRVEPL